MFSEVPPKLRLNTKTNACYVCGPENASGLRVSFAPYISDGAQGSRAEYTAGAEHCGWPGMLHGGIAFALMDEALAWSLYLQGLYGVTARVETRFRQPIAAGSKLVIRAWITARRRKLVDARAEIRLGSDEGLIVAEADATMYLQEMEVEGDQDGGQV